MKQLKVQRRRRTLLSTTILLAGLALAYVPLPGTQQSIVVVSGTELQELLQKLEPKFEQEHPNIQVTLKFQGSQEIVNRYLDDRNDFKPTVLIPADAEILTELDQKWRIQNNSDPFYEPPRPIAKTMLVAIAWTERGKVLFPDGRFRWERLEQAMQSASWDKIGAPADWGSFDFVMTDPVRSNSGQLTLSLWSQSKVGGTLTPTSLNEPQIQTLISLIKRSVYQPARSTDILLEEFIARGPNNADVGMVYESIALYRWQQSATNQGKPYQIYYLDPTIETVSTAAIVRRDVDAGKAQAARTFLEFLNQPAQQAVFVQYGFRPVTAGVDVQSVPNSPWQQNIPGVQAQPASTIQPPPDATIRQELQRLWERAY